MGRVVLACKSDEEERKAARAAPPFPTRFSRTGDASVVVTASVTDLCTLDGSAKDQRHWPHRGVPAHEAAV